MAPAFCCAVVICAFRAAAQEVPNPQGQSVDRPARPYTISKETTYFTGPLKPDGSIDFVAAVNQHFAQGVTPENNAARLILPLLADEIWKPEYGEQRRCVLQALGLDPEPHTGKGRFQDFRRYVESNKISDGVVGRQYDDALGRTWTEQDSPELARWLDTNREPLGAISQAATLEKFYVPMVAVGETELLMFVGLDHGLTMRSLARAYLIRANLHVAHQRWREAWDDILTIQRLGKLVGQGQTLTDGLLGVAITGISFDAVKRMIESTNPDSMDWEPLLSSWSTAPIADLGKAMRTSERAMFIQLACELVDDPDFRIFLVTGQGEMSATINKLVVSTLQQMLKSSEASLDGVLRYSNSVYDQMADLSTMEDVGARLAATTRFNKEIEEILGRDPDESLLTQVLFAKPQDPSHQVATVLLSQLLPAAETVNYAHWRSRASQQVVALALAARVVQSRTGHLPQSPRELEPFVDDATFIQPASGEPIQMRYDRGTLLIYHWGHNRQDDGGEIDGEDPKDWGIRLRK